MVEVVEKKVLLPEDLGQFAKNGRIFERYLDANGNQGSVFYGLIERITSELVDGQIEVVAKQGTVLKIELKHPGSRRVTFRSNLSSFLLPAKPPRVVNDARVFYETGDKDGQTQIGLYFPKNGD